MWLCITKAILGNSRIHCYKSRGQSLSISQRDPKMLSVLLFMDDQSSQIINIELVQVCVDPPVICLSQIRVRLRYIQLKSYKHQNRPQRRLLTNLPVLGRFWTPVLLRRAAPVCAGFTPEGGTYESRNVSASSRAQSTLNQTQPPLSPSDIFQTIKAFWYLCHTSKTRSADFKITLLSPNFSLQILKPVREFQNATWD